jgi:probable F420-dependent oxidoreductase
VLALRTIFAAFQVTAPLRFDGEFYSFSLLTDFFSPGPTDHPAVPIYIATVNTGLARVAGEVCNGVHAHPLHSVRYMTEVLRPTIADGAREAGRDAADITIAVSVERGKQAARRSMAFYGSTRTYRRVFRVHGWESATASLHAAMARGDLDSMAAVITDKMLDIYALTARWNDLASALVARYAGVADRVFPYDAVTDLRSPERRQRWLAGAAAALARRQGTLPNPRRRQRSQLPLPAHRHAAVDGHDRPGHVTGPFVQKEHHGVGELGGITPAAERDHGPDGLL